MSCVKKIAALFLSIIVFAAVMSSCATAPEPQKTDLAALASVEVKEYEGKDLSSIRDFQENSIKGPQYIDIKTYSLKIDGLVGSPKDYTYDEVLSHIPYKKVVTLDCVEGWSVDILWEGVLLKELFDEVKVQEAATTVIFHSYDGYSTSLPLSWIVDNQIMIAYKINDVVLPPERGFPFQLVAESKLGYKWARWITRIELSDDSTYQGYWESKGYSNEAEDNRG